MPDLIGSRRKVAHGRHPTFATFFGHPFGVALLVLELRKLPSARPFFDFRGEVHQRRPTRGAPIPYLQVIQGVDPLWSEAVRVAGWVRWETRRG